MIKLDNYREIVGDKVFSIVYRKMRRLYGKHMLHINSTYIGGGVAEILSSLVPLMNDVGLVAGWRTVHGNVDYYGITKKFHNALQGEKINFSEMKKKLYIQVNEQFSKYTHINDHDFVLIHDPQPLPLIQFYHKRQPWIWRCHIDLSTPDKNLWDYLKTYILRYDMIIVSSDKYKSKGTGSQLMTSLINQAYENNVDKIVLTVLADNKPAIRLYQKYGFELINTVNNREFWDGKSYPYHEMELILNKDRRRQI